MAKEKPKGVNELCLMHDCPHKRDLISSRDELTELERVNTELNSRLKSFDNLKSQGLIDVHNVVNKLLQNKDGITSEKIKEIGDEIKKAFDHKKIADIINENVSLQKERLETNKHIDSLENQIFILTEQNKMLNNHIKEREENDKRIISDLRNMDKRHEEQVKLIQKNDGTLNEQDIRLKTNEEFLMKARQEILQLKTENDLNLELKKQLNKEIKQINQLHNKAVGNLSRQSKLILSYCNTIIRLKLGKIRIMDGILRNDCLKLYNKAKTLYFEKITQEEREIITPKFEEASALMQ